MTAADLNLVVLAAASVLLVGVAAVRLSIRAGLPSLLLYLLIGQSNRRHARWRGEDGTTARQAIGGWSS
jgi:NhaP-type Na+/H+ and K+/H+ antiporter